MQYEVDQSGKVEQTEHDTVLTLSNDVCFAVVLKKKDKRALETYFRKIGMRVHFPYLVFSALLAILFYQVDPKSGILVDREYYGHEDLIEEKTTVYLKKLGLRRKIYYVFGFVGKLSPAHALAAKVSRKRRKFDLEVAAEELIDLMFGEKNKDRKPTRASRRPT